LPRRAWLTLKYLGPGQALLRAITFPLRPTPIGRWLGYGRSYGPERVKARRWYREHGRDVTIVIPTYGDPAVTIKCVRSLRRTTDKTRTRILVCDDASPNAEHRKRLARLRGAEVIQGDEQLGFARNANRGLRRAAGDVVLLNSDIVAHRGWMETLQQAAYERDDIGMAAPKLLYPDGRIQSAGSHRNLGAPEWFDHRYRFQPGRPTARPTSRARARGHRRRCCTSSATTIERIGVLDERYGWPSRTSTGACALAGRPADRLPPRSDAHHLESVTRGMEQGERELASQDLFWERWGDFFDDRDVRTDDGRLRDRLRDRGHRRRRRPPRRLRAPQRAGRARPRRPSCGLARRPPDWFDLRAPVRSSTDYEPSWTRSSRSTRSRSPPGGTPRRRVAASVRNGIPAYFVQDIETSYYPDRPEVHAASC
jgi:hypothetical protein